MYVKHCIYAVVISIFLGSGVFTVSAFSSLDHIETNNIPSEPKKPEDEKITGSITLTEAKSKAVTMNQEIKSFFLGIQIKEDQTLQAALFPNPEIEIETENFGGSRDAKKFDSAETTVQISQEIELGNKRLKRKKVASIERDLAEWSFQSKRADIINQTAKAFVNVLAAQEKLALSDGLISLAEKVFHTVSTRVKAGKVSPVEETRARVTLSSTQMVFERAKRELDASRRQLAAMWGEDIFLFEKADGDLDDIKPIPSHAQLAKQISKNPDIMRWDMEISRRRAQIDLEDAYKIPDPTFSIGNRYSNENNANTLIATASIPIPFFNRNQGRIRETRHELSRAYEDQQFETIRVSSDLSQAYQSLSSAYFEAVTLKEKVLPDAQAVFKASEEGYKQGKFDYLILLDAQKTLFDVKTQYIDALQSYHQAVADVERFIGADINSLTNAFEKQ
jgi:cobalt-zinc-cadmium efflux system outer membrane protein